MPSAGRSDAPPAARNWLLAPAILVLVALVAACGGDSATVRSTSVSISEATANRDQVEGAPGVTSTVRVRFGRNIDVPASDLPLESYFEVSALSLIHI